MQVRHPAADLHQPDLARRNVILHSLLLMVASSLMLIAIGVFMVFSATAPSSISAVAHDPTTQLFSVALRQLIFAVIGIIGAIVLALIPFQFFKRISPVLLLLGLFLQSLVLLQDGEGVAGNNNWLRIGNAALQPSEFLKLAMIIWLAMMLSRLSLAEIQTYKTIVIPALGFGISIGVVVLGGDVGTGLIFVLIGAGLFWLSGMRARQLVPLAFIFGFAGTILVVIRPSRLYRVGDYLANLFTLPGTITPTQSDYALFAFGSGGVTGAGIGAGKEKWRDLAEAHTDFIFAVIGEELGLIGVVTVILLFLALGWSLLRIAMNHRDRYAQLLAVGAALWLCGQAFANMWVVTGLLPVFGVPLPFVSMGGSSMMATVWMLGVVAATTMDVPGVKESLTVRRGLVRQARALIRRK
ncbi:FtsW/RodA/SpoVE family cell cycle protein [Arcanobacterium pinnipediorum]|uniref:Probable peptidoglycan glycosyltransferase FtsW n=1 Tax=Arcanobacterium pinnipediorum TaxID=1503041 RepID=A0ABY5AIJ2_9ACTO|nr:FtsW/RodA/SpoVE family cell cycle protein [Arcanobacterium pinnipediorum]USR80030.1 FtsW/RodA/SpoVE family cell cycle protein [Arcanobacterium pinnipediorum]